MMANRMNKQHLQEKQPMVRGGLPVRTNLRAGLAWDDLDDQAAAFWGKLKGAVSSATDTGTASVTPTQS